MGLARTCAQIARACRSNETVFETLIECKEGDDAPAACLSPKRDFKTIADVLIQAVLTFRIAEAVRAPASRDHDHLGFKDGTVIAAWSSPFIRSAFRALACWHGWLIRLELNDSG